MIPELRLTDTGLFIISASTTIRVTPPQIRADIYFSIFSVIIKANIAKKTAVAAICAIISTILCAADRSNMLKSMVFQIVSIDYQLNRRYAPFL